MAMQAATSDEENNLMAEAPAQAAAGWNLRGRHVVIACAAVGMTACVALATLAISAPRKSRGAVSTDGITQLEGWWDDDTVWHDGLDGSHDPNGDSHDSYGDSYGDSSDAYGDSYDSYGDSYDSYDDTYDSSLASVGSGDSYDSYDDTYDSSLASVGSSSSCEVLWNLRVADMIAQGWGSRALYAAAFYQRFHDWAGCTFYTAQAIAEEWEGWGMEAPFQAVDAGTWNSLNADPSFQDVDGAFMVRMRGASMGEAMGQWSGNPQTKDLVFQDWAGCFSEYDSTILTMFSAFLQRPKAMSGSYVGIHVRHGDKINEGPISSFEDTMALVSSQNLREVWLATDDASLMEQTPAYESAGYTISSASYSRQAGGESVTCDGLFCHHDNSQDASSAVMTDILQLASATVMIGNWNSNFFRIAWLLNYLRRSETERMADWCWDVQSGLPCGDRQSFVNQWVQAAGGWGLPEGSLPSGFSVQGCSRPY